MRWKVELVVGFTVAVIGGCLVAMAQAPQSRYLAPPNQVVAVRAGRLFDPHTGTMLSNQVILIKGDQITDVGPSVQVPAGVRVIDLSAATVLPGMLDTHSHLYGRVGTPTERDVQAITRAQAMLDAGFTMIVDMDSRGGYGTVDIRNMINKGQVQGPRMQVVGPALNPRASGPWASNEPAGAENIPWVEGKNLNSPWLARGAARETAQHGVDIIKYWANRDFEGDTAGFDEDAQIIAPPAMSLEEMTAIAEEAHMQGLKVACHALSTPATKWVIEANCDIAMHMHVTDDATIKMMVQKKTHYQPTFMDWAGMAPGQLKQTGGRNSHLMEMEKSFKRIIAAGVPVMFGSACTCPTAAQQFGKHFVRLGMTPTAALQTTYLNAAEALNWNVVKHVGSVEKGKFADIIAVSGNPLTDISEMERVKFVMKGGVVVRNDLNTTAASTSAAR